jgi:hypothetical protein
VNRTVTATATVNGGVQLENKWLRVVVIGPHGMLTSILDKRAGREVLKPGQLGNKLELFEDRPVSWDAWDIDIFFEDRGEVVGGLTRMEIVETGPLRAVVEIERAFRRSRLVQRMVMHRARSGSISRPRSTGTRRICCSRPPSRWISAPPGPISKSSGARSTARPTATPAGTPRSSRSRPRNGRI